MKRKKPFSNDLCIRVQKISYECSRHSFYKDDYLSLVDVKLIFKSHKLILKRHCIFLLRILDRI